MTVYKGTNLIAGVPDLTNKADNNAVVHLNGLETINGVKKFLSNPVIFNSFPQVILQSTDIDYTNTSVSENKYLQHVYFDKNNIEIGASYLVYYTSGIRGNRMTIKNSSGVNSDISIFWNSTNGFFTYAPPSDVNNSIVTTVNQSKAADGHFKLGNGLIIQWGSGEISSNVYNITFPTAFTSTNYRIMATRRSAATTTGDSASIYRRTGTTTTCQLYSYNNSMTVDWVAVGY